MARHFFLLGPVLVGLELTVPAVVRNLALQLTSVAGLSLIVVADWRTANRWERERAAAP